MSVLILRAPANQNDAAWADLFRKQCEVESILAEQDMDDAEIEMRHALKTKRIINLLIERGRA
jgi:hypothetical protein